MTLGLHGTVRKGGGSRSYGYRIVRANGYRNWYLHRAVADMLIKNWNPLGLSGLPNTAQVHHIDGNRGHCCPQNLLICIDPELHPRPRALRCPYTGQFISRDEWERRFQ